MNIDRSDKPTQASRWGYSVGWNTIYRIFLAVAELQMPHHAFAAKGYAWLEKLSAYRDMTDPQDRQANSIDAQRIRREPTMSDGGFALFDLRDLKTNNAIAHCKI